MARSRVRGLLGTGVVVLDGGLATELEAAGHDLSDARWSARLLEDDPAAIVAAHRAYVAAGAQVVITASYQTADPVLAARSVELARAAGAAIVAGSVGPYGAVLAGGQEYTGDYGDVDLAAFHAPRLRALAGADVIACETIPRADEAAVLGRLLDELGAPEAWVSFSCRDARTTNHGEPIEQAVAAALGGSRSRVVAVGVNCTAPEHVAGLLRRMRAVTDVPLVAYPNAGAAWDARGARGGGGGPRTLPEPLVRECVEAGARLVGGCCGFGPAAIRELAALGPSRWAGVDSA